MLQENGGRVPCRFLRAEKCFFEERTAWIAPLRFAASACFVIQRKKLAINTSTMKTKVSIGIAASFVITR